MNHPKNAHIITNNCNMYHIIPNTKHILLTLIENINSNSLFKKHVSKLSLSSKLSDVKKATLINYTIQNIKVYNTKNKPLFLAKDIGILLGISHVKMLVKKFESEEKIVGYIRTTNKDKQVIFLTKLGVYRCFYTSRSPLAKLFRKFIGNLLDHMVTHESNLLKKISEKFQIQNPDLIEEGMNDLHDKLIEYEKKYIEEKEKADLLMLECNEERKKREVSEQETLEVVVVNSFNMMHIEQLKVEKQAFIDRIKNINNTILDESSESIDLLEIEMIKKKYMKQMYIYILHPTYFTKLLLLKLKFISTGVNNNIVKDSNTQNKHNDPINTIQQIKLLLQDMPNYTKNFNNIFSNQFGVKIENNEILYYCIGFARNISKPNKLIYVNTQWISTRAQYNKILYSFAKFTLYKTSLEDISDVAREEFCQMNANIYL
jgi:prophage antirepressor-like protein